jgi:hypothetical protein
MPRLHMPGPVEGQAVTLEQFGERHVEAQKQKEPEQAQGPRHQSTPSMPALKLDSEQNIETYAKAVREAVKFYGDERTQGRENAQHNGKLAGVELDQERGKRVENELRLSELREKTIQDAERQIDLVLKTMKPTTGETLRPLIDKHLEQLIELSNVGTPALRPGLEPIENKGVLQRGIGPIAQLEMGRDGSYSLVGANGQRVEANGDFAFAITASNPTQIRVGSREQGGHMALTGGGDVYFAGELHFNNGKLVAWDNGSGHYMPTNEQRKQVSETAIASLETLLPRDKYKAYNG